MTGSQYNLMNGKELSSPKENGRPETDTTNKRNGSYVTLEVVLRFRRKARVQSPIKVPLRVEMGGKYDSRPIQTRTHRFRVWETKEVVGCIM